MFKWLARVYRKAKSCPNYTFGAEGNGCSLGRPLLHCGPARPAHSAFMTRALNTVSHHASVGPAAAPAAEAAGPLIRATTDSYQVALLPPAGSPSAASCTV